MIKVSLEFEAGIMNGFPLLFMDSGLRVSRDDPALSGTSQEGGGGVIEVQG